MKNLISTAGEGWEEKQTASFFQYAGSPPKEQDDG